MLDLNLLRHDFNQVVDNSHDFTVVILSWVKFKINPAVLQNIIDIIFRVVDGLDLIPESFVGFHLFGLRILDQKVFEILIQSFIDEKHEISKRNSLDSVFDFFNKQNDVEQEVLTAVDFDLSEVENFVDLEIERCWDDPEMNFTKPFLKLVLFLIEVELCLSLSIVLKTVFDDNFSIPGLHVG